MSLYCRAVLEGESGMRTKCCLNNAPSSPNAVFSCQSNVSPRNPRVDHPRVSAVLGSFGKMLQFVQRQFVCQ